MYGENFFAFHDQFYLNADDLIATHSGPNLKNVLSVIGNEFLKVLDRLRANKPKINLRKKHI